VTAIVKRVPFSPQPSNDPSPQRLDDEIPIVHGVDDFDELDGSFVPITP
jgi:hypothetical protein